METTDPQQNASLDSFASVYATVFANMDQGFCLLEKVHNSAHHPSDFRYLMANPAFEKHTGLSEVVGKTIRQVIPQVEPETMALYEQVALTGQSTQFETYVAPLDRWMEANAFRISQQPTQIAVLFTNITERKRAEEAQQVSEVKYRTLFETMEQGFGIGQILPADEQAGVPMDYQWLEVNPQFERLTGLARADVLTQTTRQLVPGLEETWYEGYGHVATTGETVSFEAYSPVLSRWFEVYVFALGSPASRRVGVLFSNTTERKQQQKRQALLLKLADATRSLTASVDIMAAVSELVGGYYEVGRCGFADVPPPYDHLVIDQDWSNGTLPSLQRVYPLSSWDEQIISQFRSGQTVAMSGAVKQAQSQPQAGELNQAAASRSSIWVPLLKEGQWVASFFVQDTDNRSWTEGEVSLLEEIAERTWAAVVRARAEEALREEYRRKDQFMAMLGHELRNPLAAMTNTLLVLELTQGQDQSLPYAKGIQMLTRHSQHLTRMVDDLLDMSRIRQGIVRLEWEVVNLNELLELTVEDAQPLYRERNRQLSLALPAQPLYVRGDEARLAQVVMNLLTNGAKYTHPQGKVWVSLELAEDQAILRVGDNGIGLTQEERTGIFEVFVQGATSLDRPHGGLGLGLTVVKHLVEQHRGQIQAFSPGLEQGSEFVIRLPRLRDLTDRASTRQDEQAYTSGRVLVVDDNADFADMTARLLRSKGFEVYTRYTGAQGLAGAESLRPDALLLDLGMPYLDGYEVCRQIRAQVWGQAMAIIALTGYGLEADQQKAAQAGFDGYLLKPVDLGTLAQVVAEGIHRTKKH
ncbi:ATP-binding protein [Larkinella insperata]|uniref:histidine kinase n=1 Tax=Larkinella insperata TaxID=332158 RepID=A0ABW3QNU0_9BACT